MQLAGCETNAEHQRESVRVLQQTLKNRKTTLSWRRIKNWFTGGG
jgi:hypothetical protein